MISPLVSLTLALVVCFIGAQVFRRLGYPQILGQLVAALFLAIPWVRDTFFAGEVRQVISLFSELGVVLLLLLTGFELNLHRLKRSSRDAGLVAFFATVTPLLFGIIGGRLLGFGWVTSLILGMCLAMTAEGTKVVLLMEMKKLNSKLGVIMLGAGILDDVFEMIFLTLVLLLATHSLAGLIYIPLKYLVFFAFIYLMHWIAPRFIRWVENEHSELSLFELSVIIGLFYAMVSELAGLGALIGAFLGGVTIQHSLLRHKDATHDSKDIEIMTFGFIVPFFFVNIGLNFDFSALTSNLGLTVAVTLIALSATMLGTMLVHPFSKLSWKQLTLIGWAMNSRGVMELVVANIALTAGLITAPLYSSIVVMAILTTLIFPFILKRMLAQDAGIMDR